MANPNPDWKDKLVMGNEKLSNDQIETINLFKRKEIFEHGYRAENLFDMFYNSSSKKKVKRQPNCFMIFRAILGLIADKKKIKDKLGDGTQQSILAGLIWGGANNEEKDKFKLLATQFGKLHKEHFPEYRYKPRPRSSEIGAVVDIKTAIDYHPNWPIASTSAPVPSCVSSSIIYQQFSTNESDENSSINGYSPQRSNPVNTYHAYQQPDSSSINENLDDLVVFGSYLSQSNHVDNVYQQPDHFPTNELDEHLFIYGLSSYQSDSSLTNEFDGSFHSQQQTNLPTIAVNIPSLNSYSQDPNVSQTTTFNVVNNPYDPSSTFYSDNRYSRSTNLQKTSES